MAESARKALKRENPTAQEAADATISTDPVRWHGGKSPAELRDRIVAFEAILRELPQIDIPVTQYFSAGVYLRQIDIPAGTIMTGKIHRHRCMSIVLSGEMEVITDQGPRHVKGPCVFESPAGVKRAGRAITDCVWLTAHPYDGPELEEDAMCAIFCVDTFDQLEHQS